MGILIKKTHPGYIFIQTMETDFARCFVKPPPKNTIHHDNSVPHIKRQLDIKQLLPQQSRTLQPVRNIATDLSSFVERCNNLATTLNGVIDTTEDLLQQHATTTRKTQEVHRRCHKLMASKDKLDDVVRQMIEPLAYFDCLDALCARVGLPPESVRFVGNDGGEDMMFDVAPLDLQSVAPDSPEMFDVLDKTAECLKYLRIHRSFRDGADYTAGFLMVEKRALLLIKNDVFDKLARETTKILEHMDGLKSVNGALQQKQEDGTESSSLMDGSDHLELLPPYTWWGNIGDMLRGQLGEITKRARVGREDFGTRHSTGGWDGHRNQEDEEDEHGTILHECQRFYFGQRTRLIGDIVQERLSNLMQGRSATELACLGCTLLAHVFSLEAKLFASFFTPELRDRDSNRRSTTTTTSTAITTTTTTTARSVGDDAKGEPNKSLPLANSASRGANSSNDETLTIMLEGDSGNVFEEAMSALSNQLYESVRPMIIQMMDMDELCDFIVVLNGDVLDTQLKASPLLSKVLTGTAHQLVEDAQERLAYRAQRYVADDIEGYQPTSAELLYPDRLMRDDGGQEGDENTEGDGTTGGNKRRRGARAASDWYAPLDKTLMCLAKLYRCVDMDIFEGIARQALLACTDRFNQAATAIETRLGDKVNANLFLIKHILVLREQISPFEINFTSTEVSLDFSTTTTALSTFVSSGARMAIFRLDGTNPLVELIASSVPNVVHEEINTKQLLETQLKSACEAFILNTTTETASPLLDLLRNITNSDEESYKNDVVAPPMPVTGAQVAQVLDEVVKSIETKMPKIMSLLSLYLSNSATEQVLFKPVGANINEAVHRLRGLMLRFSAKDRAALQTKMDAVESALRRNGV
jgi:hypothetical protein